jgi:CspA family cold shock protein
LQSINRAFGQQGPGDAWPKEYGDNVETVGIVREFDSIQGVGVVDSPDTPGGCWVHFSMIDIDGYKTLQPGEEVALTFESAVQDGFSYRAVRVRRVATQGMSPQALPKDSATSPYSSQLRIDPPH